MPLEDVGNDSVESFKNVSSDSLMSDSLTSAAAVARFNEYFFTNSDPGGTPVGSNGWPRHGSVNSASQIILWHMGRTISATGKTKVGGNANFVLIRNVHFVGLI